MATPWGVAYRLPINLWHIVKGLDVQLQSTTSKSRYTSLILSPSEWGASWCRCSHRFQCDRKSPAIRILCCPHIIGDLTQVNSKYCTRKFWDLRDEGRMQFENERIECRRDENLMDEEWRVFIEKYKGFLKKIKNLIILLMKWLECLIIYI